MKIYVVGGAVRDELLGLPVKDRDWVVVGATPGEMLAQGYLQVGRDFPVFLHPTSRAGAGVVSSSGSRSSASRRSLLLISSPVGARRRRAAPDRPEP